jgi:DNA-binding NarL/FixJ family response regulator
LSQREIEVLSLIAGGNSNKLIANQLKISGELGVNDRTHAVTVGLKRGIIEL